MEVLIDEIKKQPLRYLAGIATSCFIAGVLTSDYFNEKIIEEQKLKLNSKESLITRMEADRTNGAINGVVIELNKEKILLEAKLEVLTKEKEDILNESNKIEGELERYIISDKKRKEILENLVLNINKSQNQNNKIIEISKIANRNISTIVSNIPIVKSKGEEIEIESYTSKNFEKLVLYPVMSNDKKTRRGSVARITNIIKIKKEDNDFQNYIAEYYIKEIPSLIKNEKFDETFNITIILATIETVFIKKHMGKIHRIYRKIKGKKSWIKTYRIYKSIYS